MTDKQTILILSDLHAPHMHPDTLAFLKEIKRFYKPDEVVCIGDEADFHAMSFHDSDPDLESAGDELIAARKQLKPIFEMFPKVVCLESNHGSMVARKALANGMPRALFKTPGEVLNAPKGWRWKTNHTVKTPLGPVFFTHGISASAGALSSQFGMSTVQGHYHEKAQISYTSTPERLIFDMHVGCLVNDKSRALAYNKLNKKRPIISVAIIYDGVPIILPMALNKKGRWAK